MPRSLRLVLEEEGYGRGLAKASEKPVFGPVPEGFLGFARAPARNYHWTRDTENAIHSECWTGSSTQVKGLKCHPLPA